MAKQEAAPHRLSNQTESTTSAPLRGTCQMLSSHLRQRWVSQQRANPKRTDDGSALVKDLLDVSLVPEITVQSIPVRLRHHPSTKRYHPFFILFPLDSASIHQATSLR
jgi:hypothetical protein